MPRLGFLRVRQRGNPGVIIAPRNKLHCWCCGKEISKGGLHIFRFSRRLRPRFVAPKFKGIFILCATCFKRIPKELRTRYLWNVQIFRARTPGVDGKEAIYETKEAKIGVHVCSVALTTAEQFLGVSEYDCTHPAEHVKRRAEKTSKVIVS